MSAHGVYRITFHGFIYLIYSTRYRFYQSVSYTHLDVYKRQVCAAKDAVPGTDFMPLQVEYKEKFAAFGRFPGGFTLSLIHIYSLPFQQTHPSPGYTKPNLWPDTLIESTHFKRKSHFFSGYRNGCLLYTSRCV